MCTCTKLTKVFLRSLFWKTSAHFIAPGETINFKRNYVMVSLEYLISKDVRLFFFQRKFVALLCGLIWHCAFIKGKLISKANLLETPLPEKRTKYLTKFCRMKLEQNFVKYFIRFSGNGVSWKMLLRFTDLYILMPIKLPNI